jgi:hypothetical protein
MAGTILVPGAQDAVLGNRCLVAVIERKTGRQIVGMSAALLAPSLIELRCAGEGFGWHDNYGCVWVKTGARWSMARAEL